MCWTDGLVTNKRKQCVSLLTSFGLKLKCCISRGNAIDDKFIKRSIALWALQIWTASARHRNYYCRQDAVRYCVFFPRDQPNWAWKGWITYHGNNSGHPNGWVEFQGQWAASLRLSSWVFVLIAPLSTPTIRPVLGNYDKISVQLKKIGFMIKVNFHRAHFLL